LKDQKNQNVAKRKIVRKILLPMLTLIMALPLSGCSFFYFVVLATGIVDKGRVGGPVVRWERPELRDCKQSIPGWSTNPLVNAAIFGDQEKVKQLLQVRMEPDHASQVALLMAAYCDHREIAELLVNHGADFKTNYGEPLIIELAKYTPPGTLDKLLKKLIPIGLNINERNNQDQTTALHILAAHSYYTMKNITVLLDHKIEVDARTTSGETAFMVAEKMGNQKAMELLKR
jgi:ankyrin repeat protein